MPKAAARGKVAGLLPVMEKGEEEEMVGKRGEEAKEEEGGLKEVERVGAMEKGEEGLVGGGAAAAAKGAAFGKGCGG